MTSPQGCRWAGCSSVRGFRPDQATDGPRSGSDGGNPDSMGPMLACGARRLQTEREAGPGLGDVRGLFEPADFGLPAPSATVGPGLGGDLLGQRLVVRTLEQLAQMPGAVALVGGVGEELALAEE